MPPRKPRIKAPAPNRPASLGGVLRDLHAGRPAHVPEHATLMVAWIDLPGDNTQRTQHWAVKRCWQDAVRHDFKLCLNEQDHPGLLERPHIHVEMRVAAKGDERNTTGRAKFILDRLQLRREVGYVRDGKSGVRVFGDLDIIRDDKVLNQDNCTLAEVRTPAPDRKVLMWAWEGEAA